MSLQLYFVIAKDFEFIATLTGPFFNVHSLKPPILIYLISW